MALTVPHMPYSLESGGVMDHSRRSRGELPVFEGGGLPAKVDGVVPGTQRVNFRIHPNLGLRHPE